MKDDQKLHLAGTQRTIAFEETIERVRPMFPALGITRVADVTGLDRIGIPVWTACRPNSRSLSVSQGKGPTADAARASAIMECLELHHAERPVVPLQLASNTELMRRGVPVVDVSVLPGTKASRYHPERPLLWAEATDLSLNCRAWVPFEAVHTSALLPPPTGSGCFSSTSNGLASGNHILEATVHALCEVIERDAAAVWQALPSEHREDTPIDLATIENSACRNVLERYAAAEILVAVDDITSDIGVPAFLCEISDFTSERPTRYSGMGCHLHPEIALLRALTEAAQSRLTYITGSRDDIFRTEYRAVRQGFRISSESTPVERRGVRSLRSAPSAVKESSTFGEDLEILKCCLRRVGLDSVLSIDLTSPEYRIPVVRVIVPGLEGPDDEPNYVPGMRAKAAHLCKKKENG